MFKIVAALSCLVGVALAGVPSFRIAYDQPDGQVGQFYSGPSSDFVYNWGYQYPGQSHSENKFHDGTVEGGYAFKDAAGQVQQATYRATPTGGFVVDQSFTGDAAQAVPVAPVAVVPESYSPVESETFSVGVDSVPSPVVPSQEAVVLPYSDFVNSGVALDSGTEERISRASPVILRAVREGKLVPVLGYENEIVFRVGDSLVDEAQGSVSNLARILDVDTVAPRRDAQVPVYPKAGFYSALQPSEVEPQIRASLDTDSFSDGSAYIVRIPYV